MTGAAAMHLEAVFFRLMHAAAQASVLACLILLLQWALGRRLGARGRSFLWLTLLILLALPWIAPHGIGPGTLWSGSPAQDGPSSLVHSSSCDDLEGTPAELILAQQGRSPERAEETMMGMPLPWPGAAPLEAPVMRALTLLWLAGAVVVAAYIACAQLRLRRRLTRASAVTDPAILALLEDCKRLLGVRAGVDVLATDAVDGPALFGYARPRLLLPHGFLRVVDPVELRHIFLHELAHLRRRDILFGHIASLIHVGQWFNPLVGLALRRMRSDRELACDALVLSVLDPDEARAYGRTVVHQIERFRAARRPPILAAISGDKSRIKHRIALIAGFDKARDGRSGLTATLLASLICLGLGAAFAGRQALGAALESAIVNWEVRARRDLPTTHQDQHANIQRACIRNEMTGKFLVVRGQTVACDADEPGDAGLWEIRFDEASNTAQSDVYLYSAAARKYLTSDGQGNLVVDADTPTEAARWGTYPRPQGMWLISHHFRDGYLRLDGGGQVKAVRGGRDAPSYWDVHAVWRVKTSDDPAANPQWQREKIPGPD